MYFPEDMNFQYFFFDTYIGYFLQTLPIALIVGAIYGIIRFRNDKTTSVRRKVFSCAFVCYLTGLVCLVIGLDLMGICYYKLFYRMDPGREIQWFGGVIDLVPDFLHHISGEVIGNFLMFLPFGLFLPFVSEKVNDRNIWKIAVLVPVVVEVIQPIVGRNFDIDDLILNFAGIVVGYFIAPCIKGMKDKLRIWR